jgi:hypothetical protein
LKLPIWTTRIALALATAPLFFAPTAACADSVSADIGLDALRGRPNALRADGAGEIIAQVEATLANGAVAPDTTSPAYADKSFTFVGINSTPVSPHASEVANRLYGPGGIAPGVADIKVFSEDSFVYSDGLHADESQPPERLGVSIINNSWIGASSSAIENKEILRRLDFVAARDNVLVVNAVDNQNTGDFPILMASEPNGLSVGVPGDSSVGPATFDGGPRAKPDLIAPAANTSEAAATVSGAAAILLSEAKARRLPINALATKAMLMAGAKHLAGYKRGNATPADDTRVPLDYSQGAGQLRIDHSFDIMTSGRKRAGTPVKSTGWATGTALPQASQVFSFNVTKTIPSFQAILDWNRDISLNNNNALSVSTRAARLANLDLQLQKKSRNNWVNVFKSASKTDNVEALSLTRLGPGTYRMLVTTNVKEPYALAWYSDMSPAQKIPTNHNTLAAGGPLSPMLSATPVPEPGTMLLATASALLLLSRRRRREHGK